MGNRVGSGRVRRQDSHQPAALLQQLTRRFLPRLPVFGAFEKARLASDISGSETSASAIDAARNGPPPRATGRELLRRRCDARAGIPMFALNAFSSSFSRVTSKLLRRPRNAARFENSTPVLSIVRCRGSGAEGCALLPTVSSVAVLN